MDRITEIENEIQKLQKELNDISYEVDVCPRCGSCEFYSADYYSNGSGGKEELWTCQVCTDGERYSRNEIETKRLPK